MRDEIFIHPSLYVDKSKYGGYGIFTDAFIPENTVIEISHCIPLTKKERKGLKTILNYDFVHNDNVSYIALGFGSMYNHHDNNNVTWRTRGDRKVITTTIRDIHPYEELFSTYGDKYFEERGMHKIIDVN